MTTKLSRGALTIADMNGASTAGQRPLSTGLLSAGWFDGNTGENGVARALHAAGITPSFNAASGPLCCVQQFEVGPYCLDFAWPKLKIALEADGGIHARNDTYRRDRKRDAWLRSQGWLVFRVDTSRDRTVQAQVGRVLQVVTALARP